MDMQRRGLKRALEAIVESREDMRDMADLEEALLDGTMDLPVLAVLDWWWENQAEMSGQVLWGVVVEAVWTM